MFLLKSLTTQWAQTAGDLPGAPSVQKARK